jgi:hypothetical protein
LLSKVLPVLLLNGIFLYTVTMGQDSLCQGYLGAEGIALVSRSRYKLSQCGPKVHAATEGRLNLMNLLMVEPQQNTEAASTESSVRDGLGNVLVRVAWLAILLGMGMEILILLPQAGFGVLPGLESVFKDLAGKVTWSTLVCAGLAAGTAASRARAPLMGLFGFLVAPLAFPPFPCSPAGSSQDR